MLSVYKLIDDGWRVVFDFDGSYLFNKKTKKIIMLNRERGVFAIDAYAEPEPESGFSGQA